MILALVLTLLMAAWTFAAIPVSSAHTPSWNVPTYAYLSASPTTIGVGQLTQLVMWLDTIVPTSTGVEGDLWHGFSIAVTAPDGSKQTMGPYTSGSTGEPKGVAVVHRGVVRLVCGTDYARFGPDEVFLQAAPVSFDASTFEIWGALLNGGRLVVLAPQTPGLDPNDGAVLGIKLLFLFKELYGSF